VGDGYLLGVSLGFEAERYSATALTTAVAATFSKSSTMVDIDGLLGGCTFLIPRARSSVDVGKVLGGMVALRRQDEAGRASMISSYFWVRSVIFHLGIS
jgi:hypothetical protein